jgi:hypothetical protein
MTPALIPCSRSARPQKGLARRPQWDQHGCHPTGERNEQAWREHYTTVSIHAHNRGSTRLPLKRK